MNTLQRHDITLYIHHSLENMSNRVMNTLARSDFTPRSIHSTGMIDMKGEQHPFRSVNTPFLQCIVAKIVIAI